MKLVRKELIVSVIIVIAFVFVAINFEVLATNIGNSLDMNYTFGTGNQGNTGTIDGMNTDLNVGTIPQTNTNSNNISNNNPGQLANTGLGDWPWAIIAVCAISTVFAYKKIKEYKED